MSACDGEAAVDERGAEKPLCREDPGEGHKGVACGRLDVVGAVWSRYWTSGRARCDLQECEGEGCPEPADLDEVYVEKIMFAGKIAGGLRMVGRVEVGGDAGRKGSGVGRPRRRDL